MKRVGGTEGCLMCNTGTYNNNFIRSDYFKFKYGIWNGNFRYIYYSVPQGVWSHLVIQRNGGTIRAYVDGVMSDSGSVSQIHKNNNSGWNFDPNNSIIDQLRVSDAPLYPNAGFTPTWPLTIDASTVAFIDFNEGWGSTTRNEANEEIHTILGAVTWTTERAAACP